MYLLLAESKDNSSSHIKSLLDQNSITSDVVNCSSREALLMLAEKLSPEIVMIDLDMLNEDSAGTIRELRRHNPASYIFTFIVFEQFDRLHQAIESGIDDYILKPLQDEDVIIKTKIGMQYKQLESEEPQEPGVDAAHGDDQEQAAKTDTLRLIEEFEPVIRQELLGDFEPLEQPVQDQTVVPSYQDEDDELFMDIDDNYGEPKEDAGIPLQDDGIIDIPTESSLNDILASPELDDLPPSQEPAYHADLSGETSEEVPPASAKAEEYIKDLEGHSPSEELVGYNKDQKESALSEPYGTGISAKKEEPVSSAADLTPADLENKVNLQEEKFMQIDDAELFGIEYRRKTVDTKSFEELFGREDESGKKKKGLFGERKAPQQDKPLEDSLFSVKPEPLLQPQLQMQPKPETEQESLANILAEEPNIPPLRDKKRLVESPDFVKGKGRKAISKGSRFFNFLGNLITIILLALLFTISFFLIQGRISGGAPEIAGYKIYFVLSGSMRPAFDTGSVIFVKDTTPLAIVEGDIITFSSTADAKSLTTHRVVGINREGGLSFITRGDANNVNDPNPVEAERVIGVVKGTIPHLGYLFGFVQTRQGLILLVFIPGFLILLFEIRKIIGFLVESKVDKIAADQKD